MHVSYRKTPQTNEQTGRPVKSYPKSFKLVPIPHVTDAYQEAQVIPKIQRRFINAERHNHHDTAATCTDTSILEKNKNKLAQKKPRLMQDNTLHSQVPDGGTQVSQAVQASSAEGRRPSNTYPPSMYSDANHTVPMSSCPASNSISSSTVFSAGTSCD